MEHTTLRQWKYNIVRHIFTDTADEGYIVARWAFFHGMHRMYFWNAAHSIEKYLKASLLLNGNSVKKFNHLDVKLFEGVLKYASDLVPDSLNCPNESKPSHPIPSKEQAKKFIQRLAGDGSADNRYATYSYAFERTDIFKLDQLVFSLRRLVIGLDWKPREPIDSHCPDMCYRDILTTDERFEHLCPLKGIKGKLGSNLNSDTLSCLIKENKWFKDEDQTTTKEVESILPQNLYHNGIWFCLQNAAKNGDETALKALEWAVNNIKLSHSDKKLINKDFHWDI